jgi:hypothetical protein
MLPGSPPDCDDRLREPSKALAANVRIGEERTHLSNAQQKGLLDFRDRISLSA